LSVDFVFIGAPFFVDPRGFVFTALLLFADSVYVGSPLYIDFRGFFTRL
jgi:hypothetical protein